MDDATPDEKVEVTEAEQPAEAEAPLTPTGTPSREPGHGGNFVPPRWSIGRR